MSTRRNALGRGIGALLPGAPAASPPPARVDDAARTAEDPSPEQAIPISPPPAPLADERGPVLVPIDSIDPNPDQPRRQFDEGELERLVQSIRRHGVLQPVVVRRIGDRHELLVGERRWRASRAAGLRSIPCVISNATDQDRLEIALVENVQRHDLNPIELALAFRTLADGGSTQEEIGTRVGLERSSVANHLRLLDLSRELQEDLEQHRISMGHAEALLQVGNPERRRHLRDRIVKDQLSVRAAEQLGRGAKPERPRDPTPRQSQDPNLQRVIDTLRQRLQTRVKIQGDGKRGRIEIEYFGDEDLTRLVSILVGDA